MRDGAYWSTKRTLFVEPALVGYGLGARFWRAGMAMQQWKGATECEPGNEAEKSSRDVHVDKQRCA